MADSNHFDIKHDIFEGLGLLDFIVVVEAYFDLWTREARSSSIAREIDARSSALARDFSSKTNELSSKTKLVTRELTFKTQESAREQIERIEKNLLKTRTRFSKQLKSLSIKFQEEKIVRTRDKIAFLMGVANITASLLLLGFAPAQIPIYYSIQITVSLLFRVFSYIQKAYHYFLFDLCYLVNLFVLVWLWILPFSTILFIACWGLSMGTLGIAIILWRNSLVFHSLDKMISLSIHLLPPFTLTTILFFLSDEEKQKYPGIASIETISNWKAVGINMIFYLVWQTAYYRFVIVARKASIAAGRTTSFTYLINDKKSAIGKLAARVSPKYREAAFMLGQAIFTFVTLLLPIFVLKTSKFFSSIYLLTLFGISTWNGSSFYMDVFGRGFEKELISLRLQLSELTENGTQMSRNGSAEGEEVMELVLEEASVKEE